MKKIVFFIVLLIMAFISCKTKLDEVDTNLDEKILSQRGIEAIDEDDYKLAILYFQAIIDNPPDDPAANIWAEYEIANIYYKMKEYFSSLELIDLLILKYEDENASLYPDAPLILANMLKEKILSNEDYLKEFEKIQEDEEKAKEDSEI